MRLLVNVDHVATLRNARGEGVPDPIRAARICEEAGAAGIVFHLREDRRHIRDEDAYKMKENVQGDLDFEMAATDEMIQICTDISPDLCTLVPEKREELTTEGGLQLKNVHQDFRERVIPALHQASIRVSLFVDPDPDEIEIAHDLGVEAIELHTGTYSNADTEEGRQNQLRRLAEAAEKAHELGLQVNAGHGLNFDNIQTMLDRVPHLHEVSIGHALISDAIFNGLSNTVSRMAHIVENYEG